MVYLNIGWLNFNNSVLPLQLRILQSPNKVTEICSFPLYCEKVKIKKKNKIFYVHLCEKERTGKSTLNFLLKVIY